VPNVCSHSLRTACVIAALGAPAVAAAGTPAAGDLVDVAAHAPLDWFDVSLAPECDPAAPLPPSEWLASIGTPGRAFDARERHNATVIYRTFREAGLPHSIAFAAIVNAWAESALDSRARMTQPFAWKGLYYPKGTGAIGLFQLLPSPGGAGGPSGPERGYSRTFLDGRWAGTPWQASRYGDTPDGRGRRYYDGTDPVLNTERIILEVERDGDRLMAAWKRGATIAELADIFGRDIERPQLSTRHRRYLAVKMFGPELALTRHPDRLFAPERPREPAYLSGGPQSCPRTDGFAPSTPRAADVAVAFVEPTQPDDGWGSWVSAFSTALSGLNVVVRWG